MMPPTTDPANELPDFKRRTKKPYLGAALAGLLVGILGTVAATFVIGAGDKESSKKARKPEASASAKAQAKKPTPPADAGTEAEAESGDPLAAKAAQGDPDAIKAIETLPIEQRTAEQMVALYEARAVAKRKEIAELAHKIELVPKFAAEPNTRKTIVKYAADSQVAGDLVVALANLPGEAGPDLLFRIGPKTWRRTPAKTLATDALYAKGVRSKADPGLSVYLDLRIEEDCEKVMKILERAKASGDSRSLGQLARLRKKTGCGPKKRNDCWPCLRKQRGKLLKDAIAAAGKRKVR
jgi:serine/threonine-protein kinase